MEKCTKPCSWRQEGNLEFIIGALPSLTSKVFTHSFLICQWSEILKSKWLTQPRHLDDELDLAKIQMYIFSKSRFKLHYNATKLAKLWKVSKLDNWTPIFTLWGMNRNGWSHSQLRNRRFESPEKSHLSLIFKIRKSKNVPTYA